jgi:hypothetical protein
MRTTVTFEPDVAARLEQLRVTSDRSFKDLVNDALRAGLDQLDRAPQPRGGPYTRPVDLGRPRLPDIDDVSEALAITEGEDHR